MPRLIAFYLPQYHPITENNEWWGEGFTEWTNSAKARPLFRGHYQPHVPADLGFYDLRVPETRFAQAKMAAAHGIEGFCYYHYWFAGRQMLNRPLDEVLASQSPDFPFCLCWANQSWTGIWHGVPGRTLIEQTYPGEDDHRAHFESIRPAFKDRRYLTVEGKPIFVVFQPHDFSDPANVIDLWRAMARTAGFPGLHLVANTHADDATELRELGFDGVIRSPMFARRRWLTSWRRPIERIINAISFRIGRPLIVDYDVIRRDSATAWQDGATYPCVVHAWDNTPRSGRNGVAYVGSSPAAFRDLLATAMVAVSRNQPDNQLIFLKSWNEWAEGNHLEPDLKDGRTYLRAIAEALCLNEAVTPRLRSAETIHKTASSA